MKICKIISWRCQRSNPGPFTCKANALPLSYIPCWFALVQWPCSLVGSSHGATMRQLVWRFWSYLVSRGPRWSLHKASFTLASKWTIWRKRKEWVPHPFSASTQHPHRQNVTIWRKCTAADQGFSQGGANSPGGGGGANIRFCQIFPKTAWNRKNLGAQGGRRVPPAPPINPPLMHTHTQMQTRSANGP